MGGEGIVRSVPSVIVQVQPQHLSHVNDIPSLLRLQGVGLGVVKGWQGEGGVCEGGVCGDDKVMWHGGHRQQVTQAAGGIGSR